MAFLQRLHVFDHARFTETRSPYGGGRRTTERWLLKLLPKHLAGEEPELEGLLLSSPELARDEQLSNETATPLYVVLQLPSVFGVIGCGPRLKQPDLSWGRIYKREECKR